MKTAISVTFVLHFTELINLLRMTYRTPSILALLALLPKASVGVVVSVIVVGVSMP